MSAKARKKGGYYWFSKRLAILEYTGCLNDYNYSLYVDTARLALVITTPYYTARPGMVNN